jgi:hypothetical protein
MSYGIPINIKNTKFVKDLSMIDAQFRFNQCNIFREEHISLYGPLQTLGFLFRYEIQNGGYGRTKFNFGPYGKNVSKRFFSPGQFGFICPSGFREEAF